MADWSPQPLPPADSQGIGNPIVELLALTPHHIGISGILEQLMLEHIG